MNKIKEMKLEYYLMFIMILQPFIDIYRTFFQGQFEIGIAVEELVNIVLIGIVALLAFTKLIMEKDKKHLIIYGVYFVVLTIYLAMHVINVSKYNPALYNPESDPITISHFVNIYYIMRVYVMPVVFMISVFTIGISDDKFIKTLQIVSITISGIIVLSNITNTSLISYSDGQETIAGGLLTWGSLNSESEFELYTSKGFFYSANQMSSLLFALMPIMVGELIRKVNLKNILVVFVQMVAMLMIGTKTAAQGTLIVLGFVLFVAIVLYFIRSESFIKVLKGTEKFAHWLKQQNLKRFVSVPLILCMLAGGVGIYFNSPSYLRIKHMQYLNSSDQREEKEVEIDLGDNEMIAYIEHEYWFYYINGDYIDLYPVRDNLDFWVDMISRDRRLNRDQRNLKVQIIKDIIKNNENPQDKLFGIGKTALGNLYTERDYMYQYFIFGAMGVLLLMGPFFGVVLLAAVRILMKLREKATLLNVTLGMSLCIYFATAYIAGHTFGILINMLFMAFYGGKLLINIQD